MTARRRRVSLTEAAAKRALRNDPTRLSRDGQLALVARVELSSDDVPVADLARRLVYTPEADLGLCTAPLHGRRSWRHARTYLRIAFAFQWRGIAVDDLAFHARVGPVLRRVTDRQLAQCHAVLLEEIRDCVQWNAAATTTCCVRQQQRLLGAQQLWP